MSQRNQVISPVLVCILLAVFPTASPAAVIVPLVIDEEETTSDSGWEVQIPDDVHYGVNVDSITEGPDGFVAIEISKEFLQGPSPFGVVPGVIMTFRQTADDANTVPTIVINDEIVTNSTGVTWIDFHFILLDSGTVNFDPKLSAGFNVGPAFTSSTFSDNNTRLDISGGPGVGDGVTWNPGGAPEDGELVINVEVGEPGARIWHLKELPTIPEPATLAWFTTAGLLGLRVRRRNA